MCNFFQEIKNDQKFFHCLNT